ncbi:MAG: methyltransferase [Gemmatimonadaceae bacterium]|nr:methyltransferase [Gemmatimonadaceae bacterium]
MTGSVPQIFGPDYRAWQRGRVVVGDRAFHVATKPGLFAHGHEDPATQMLAAEVTECAGQRVVSMSCGNGLVGAVAAASGASQVWMTDRNALAIDASQRTLKANAVNGAVRMGHGAGPLPLDVMADVVAIRVVAERIPMLILLHDALRILRPGGRCLLAGANHEGAKSAARLLERLFGNAKTLAQHRGHRLVVATRPAQPPDISDELITPFTDPHVFRDVPVSLRGRAFTLSTRPGVFSWEHLDEATEVLAGLIDITPGERVLDIGCGAGALGVVAAHLSHTGVVCLVDVDSEAVRCATQTLHAAGVANARALVSDVASAVRDESFDVVVANPPFHVGTQVDLDVPRQFIRDAFDVLVPGGRVLLVANRTLPYEAMLSAQFGAYRSLYDGRRFKVLSARRA